MNETRLYPRSRLLLATTLFCHLCLATVLGHAQSSFEANGRVVAVDELQRTVTLDHGPIPGLMPAMRRAFPVQQFEQLHGLPMGAAVRFSLQAGGPAWVIATSEPVGEHPPPRSVSFPAPDFTLPTLSGAPIHLSALRGKVVLVNFWATWCGSCRAEMPALNALYQRYKDRGLEVLAVNLDTDSTSNVQAFARKIGVTFRVGLDPSSSTARSYRVRSLPTTYLIDRAGNVVVQEVGGRDWLDAVTQLTVEGLLQ